MNLRLSDEDDECLICGWMLIVMMRLKANFWVSGDSELCGLKMDSDDSARMKWLERVSDEWLVAREWMICVRLWDVDWEWNDWGFLMDDEIMNL